MRVLYLTHRLPYAPNRGDRIRAYHTLRVLHNQAKVDLVSLVHDSDEGSHVAALSGQVDSAYIAPVSRFRNYVSAASHLATTTTPLTHALLDSPSIRPTLQRLVAERRPDVVLAYCSGMTRFALEPPLAGIPLVIDLVDVDSLKWRELAAKSTVPKRWIYAREARWLSEFETQSTRAAFATLVTNERERIALATLAPDSRVEVVPSGVDREYWNPLSPPLPSDDVVFCGVMNYAPNEEGAAWLAREVWPLVQRSYGNARLRLVGSSPSSFVRGLAQSDASIEVTGAVEDVRPYLWSAAVATAPLRQARGIQNKVLEAVAAGLPTVVTPVVADGLPPEVAPACHTADAAAAFAEAIVRCLRLSPGERRAIARNADLSSLSWESRLAPLVEILQAAAGTRQ